METEAENRLFQKMSIYPNLHNLIVLGIKEKASWTNPLPAVCNNVVPTKLQKFMSSFYG